jgi:hypothetical protein
MARHIGLRHQSEADPCVHIPQTRPQKVLNEHDALCGARHPCEKVSEAEVFGQPGTDAERHAALRISIQPISQPGLTTFAVHGITARASAH